MLLIITYKLTQDSFEKYKQGKIIQTTRTLKQTNTYARAQICICTYIHTNNTECIFYHNTLHCRKERKEIDKQMDIYTDISIEREKNGGREGGNF